MALKRVVYLTDTEYATLKSTGSVNIGTQTYTPSAETEFRVIAKAKLYRHTIKFAVGDGSTGIYDFFVVLVDNYDQEYTSESIMNKYGHCTFVGHQDLDGPPGGIAIIANSFTALPPTHDNSWYAMVKYYGDDIGSYLQSASFVSDTVVEF